MKKMNKVDLGYSDKKQHIIKEGIKEFWTQHRTTLIAYQTQFIYSKKPEGESEKGIQSPTKKGVIKIQPSFQCGFLKNNGKEIKKDRDYISIFQKSSLSSLKWIFGDKNLTVDHEQLRDFVKIMLQLKSDDFFHQFCNLYNKIIAEILSLNFKLVQKQKQRAQTINRIKETIIQNIRDQQNNYPYFQKQLRNDGNQSAKFIYVTIYCFIAQMFNFNINEFYADAFSLPAQQKKTSKKVKGVDENENEEE